jgi:hypothetical protein
LISGQVSKGFEQLGSDKPVVRLGGIYALEGVMNTSRQYETPRALARSRPSPVLAQINSTQSRHPSS